MAEHEDTCDFGWSVGVLNKAYAEAVAPILDRIPRGVRGYQTLYAAATYDLPTQLALADYLIIDKSVMPYVVDDLVAAGLVRREPLPSDRRAITIVLTDRGTAVAAEATEALNRDLFRDTGFAPDEVDSLITILRRFRAHAGDFAIEG